MPSCGAGQISVRDYWRSAPRKRRKLAVYWTCVWRGTTCGVRHGSYSISLKHSSQLDRAERKRGRRANWTPTKKEAKR